ncbi:hypothetical protein CYMTET_31350 [Cymbomonas tetramitiformis]|uniref:Uncharacterized protein n=1 Tax=Cymbomonas tetramitiformis TaxID=36881 RepID=A0AAE0KSY6_9CHLO|nr:hypothetical protein CYMTET_31350 [Cymbomonas tetramitiformis]
MSKHVIVGGGTVDAVEIACPMRATGGKEIPAVAVPPGEPEHNKVAPAGAGESLVAALGSALVEATEPVPAMEMKIEELEAFEDVTRVLQFLGVLLNTEGDVCTACIDEERIAIVVKHAGELRAQAARGMVARRALESLLGVLAFCNQVVRQYHGKRVVLERRVVDERHFGTDASGTLGFGGGIFLVCVKHDIRLQTKYINTKDNLLADLLSRLDMGRFMVEHRIFSRATIRHQDRDGRMLCPVRWAELDHEFGPFMVDSCMAESKANSYCHLSWSKVEDARVQKFDGHNAWGNSLSPSWAEALAPETRRTLCIFITFYSWLVEPETIKCWGKPPRPVMPLTLADLAKMALLISAWGLGQEALWAAILVGFFGLFQKDNLTTGKTGAWNTRGALAVQGSLLCPVRAVRRFMERTAGRPEDSGLRERPGLLSGEPLLGARMGERLLLRKLLRSWEEASAR